MNSRIKNLEISQKLMIFLFKFFYYFISGTNYNNLSLSTKLASGSALPGGGGPLTLVNGDNFGSSVALYNNLLAVGAQNDATGGAGTGAAYLFSFTSGSTYTNLALNTKLANGSVLPGGGGPLTLVAGSNFGNAIALYNNLLTVGADLDSTGGAGRGAAYLLSFTSGSTYSLLALNNKLVSGSTFPGGGGPLVLANNDNFGSSVALYNNLLAIGALNDDTGGLNRGAAYLISFTSGSAYSSLTLNTKLASGSALPGGGGPLAIVNGANFGSSAAIYNNLLTIGAMNDSTGGAGRGAAYLFSFTSGSTYALLAQNNKLANGSVLTGGTTLTFVNGDNFGSSAALYGNLLAIGAMNDDTGGTNRGADYLFSFDTGTTYTNLKLNVKLASGSLVGGVNTLTLANNDLFGSSVALYNNLIAIGAPGTAGGGTNRGATCTNCQRDNNSYSWSGK